MKSIEFTGMPKAGKTTLTELVETSLKQSYRVRDIYEAARINPLDKGNRFNFNAWCFHNTMNRLMEAKSYNFDFGLIDRGVYDHITFARTLLKLEKITEEECDSQISYFSQFTKLQDYVIFFMLEPEISLERYKLHSHAGRVMNLDFLNLLYESYQETIKSVEGDYYTIDGSEPLDKNRESVLEIINLL